MITSHHIATVYTVGKFNVFHKMGAWLFFYPVNLQAHAQHSIAIRSHTLLLQNQHSEFWIASVGEFMAVIKDFL